MNRIVNTGEFSVPTGHVWSDEVERGRVAFETAHWLRVIEMGYEPGPKCEKAGVGVSAN